MIVMLYLLQNTFKRVESYKRYIGGHIYGMYMLYICVSRRRHLEIQWVEHSTKGYRLEDGRQGIYRYNGRMVGIDSTVMSQWPNVVIKKVVPKLPIQGA